MGLISTGIKAGGMFLVAREGMKAYEKHEDRKHSQDQSPPQYQNLAPASAQGNTNNQYVHQGYCNGQCGQRCGSGMREMGNDGKEH